MVAITSILGLALAEWPKMKIFAGLPRFSEISEFSLKQNCVTASGVTQQVPIIFISTMTSHIPYLSMIMMAVALCIATPTRERPETGAPRPAGGSLRSEALLRRTSSARRPADFEPFQTASKKLRRQQSERLWFGQLRPRGAKLVCDWSRYCVL